MTLDLQSLGDYAITNSIVRPFDVLQSLSVNVELTIRGTSNFTQTLLRTSQRYLGSVANTIGKFFLVNQPIFNSSQTVDFLNLSFPFGSNTPVGIIS